jgi:hypothetical protein
MYWSYLKTVTFITILSVIFGGGYLFYRTSQATQFLTLDLGRDFHSSAATVCSASLAGFDGSIAGNIYFYKGMARFTLVNRSGSDSVYVQSILDEQKIVHKWQEGLDYGLVGPLDAFSADGIRTYKRVNCAPWWSPNASIFQVPTEITFKPVS